MRPASAAFFLAFGASLVGGAYWIGRKLNVVGGGDVARFQALVRSAIGWPYVWGGGGPGRLSAGPEGVDCSGFVTNMLYRMGWVDGRERITADWVQTNAIPVPKGKQQPGDVWAYDHHTSSGYSRHVELVYSYPDATGECTLIGSAKGGVKFHQSAGYMTGPNFKGYFRVPRRSLAMV